MSAVLAQHRRWLVGLLAVLLVLGLATVGTDRHRTRHDGADRSDLAAPANAQGDVSPRPCDGASSGLLSPFAPVLDVVVTALTGSEGDADVGRCVPRPSDNAVRRAPGERTRAVAVRDGGRTPRGSVPTTATASAPATLHC